MPRIAPVVLLAVAPLAAVAQTGSGTVEFGFTSFSGPIGIAQEAAQSDPNQWVTTGLINGVTPTPGGWAPSSANPGLTGGWVTGTMALGGVDTVRMRYTWIDPVATPHGENIISFTPAPFTDVEVGQTFVLGTLSYQNGWWYGAGEPAAYNLPTDLGFEIRTHSNDGAQFNQTLSGTLRNAVHIVPGDAGTLPGNFEAEADWIYLSGAGVSLSMGAFRVYDYCCHPAGVSNVGTVEILGRFNSLDIDAFGAVQGGGFVTPGVVGPLPPVPEPQTWALLLLGLGVVGAAGARRVRRA